MTWKWDPGILKKHAFHSILAKSLEGKKQKHSWTSLAMLHTAQMLMKADYVVSLYLFPWMIGTYQQKPHVDLKHWSIILYNQQLNKYVTPFDLDKTFPIKF